METKSQASAPAGVFISFEGGEGSGKTTHINFLAKALREQGREVLCLREPGGTRVGEHLRDIVLNPDNEAIVAPTELLLYEAARAQLVAEVIRPALERGAIVLCDRFFDSTVAYQAFGRGLPLGFVQAANEFACQGVEPACTVLLLTPGRSAEEGLRRATHDRDGDRMERAGVDFHTRVNQAYLQIAAENPDRVAIVESQPTKGQTALLVFKAVAESVGWDADKLPFEPAYFESANAISGATKRSAQEVG